MSSAKKELKRTPLYPEHIQLGARMVPFAGWQMPLSYRDGIIREHLSTREGAGLFDVSHMGELLLEGSTAHEDLGRLFTADISRLDPGSAKYGFFLKKDGTFIDDLIVFKKGPQEYMLVVNASRVEADKEWVKSNISGSTVLKDLSDSIAKIDLQGPSSDRIMSDLIGPEKVASLRRFRFIESSIHGRDVLLSRTGYTGENGFEIFTSPAEACYLWKTFLGYDLVRPAGLGARDTLRLEAGYPLYGNDIGPENTPREAGLMRFVDMTKDFIGKSALEGAPVRRLRGFLTDSRSSPRKGFKMIKDGRQTGFVTSASFSPSLGRGIGFCYLDRAEDEAGEEFIASDNSRQIPVRLAELPFYDKKAKEQKERS